MKRTDLKTDDIVCLFTGWRRRRDGIDYTLDFNFRKARVLDPGPVARQKTTGWSRYDNTVIDGVQVQPLKANGHKDGDPIVVQTKDILSSWTDYEAKRDEAKSWKDEVRQGREDRAKARNDAIRAMKTMVGKDALPWWAQKADVKVYSDGSGISGGKGEIDAVALHALMQAAFEAGKASAQ